MYMYMYVLAAVGISISNKCLLFFKPYKNLPSLLCLSLSLSLSLLYIPKRFYAHAIHFLWYEHVHFLTNTEAQLMYIMWLIKELNNSGSRFYIPIQAHTYFIATLQIEDST